MKVLIDDANIESIKRITDLFPIDGVTTNPTILSKIGRNPKEVLKEIRKIIGDEADLHIQAVSISAKDIVEEGRIIVDQFGENTYIKIPANPQGFKAMKQLSSEGYKTTATVIYAPLQAFFAGKSGARYVAPYVNRIDNLGYDGIETTKQIHDILKINNLNTGVLAASFKNSNQFLQLVSYGVSGLTASPDVIDNLVKDENVDAATREFIKDFHSLIGVDKTMKDVLIK